MRRTESVFKTNDGGGNYTFQAGGSSKGPNTEVANSFAALEDTELIDVDLITDGTRVTFDPGYGGSRPVVLPNDNRRGRDGSDTPHSSELVASADCDMEGGTDSISDPSN